MVELKNAGAILTIDVRSAVKNFLKIKQAIGSKTDCAVAIKTDAYGLGAEKIAPSLAAAGCQNFFVAHVFEGEKLREIVPNAAIYILHGIPENCEDIFVAKKLTPVLNSIEQIKLWQSYALKNAQKLKAVIHIDTGMVRLGLNMSDFKKLMSDEEAFKGINPFMLMSHLACADENNHPKNEEQLNLFLEAKKLFAQRFPEAIYSFSSSAGINLGKEYHFDLVRPGIAIYGGGGVVIDNHFEKMKPVVNLAARILQINEIKDKETVGYGATWKAENQKRIATVAAGYGDGFLRSFANKLTGYIGTTKVFCAGRLSMDLITFDVTNVPLEECQVGKFIEIIGKNNTIDDIAALANTANYEIITSLGKRYYREYLI
ncbi:MAG: alanine racemase [Alphaproteobacteria bacterium]